ncbi:MAG: hypothetical protein H0V70_04910 [Ktedonobacteraceae bacterium]|nr:hypothetical protein [Ktedonobacteraceae bacterium]
MKLNSKVTNTSSTEEFALTDSELETVLGGQGWGCTPSPCDGGGSPNYGGGYPNYGGGYPNYGGGSPNYGGGSSCGGSSPNYGGGYSPNGSPSDGGTMYSVTTSTTTYYMGSPTPSGSSCGGGY